MIRSLLRSLLCHPAATAAVLLPVLAAGPVAAADYAQLLPERSSIAFTSKQMGVPVDGHFRKFSAALSFDPARPTAASARVDIDLGSIDAGSPDANDEVVGKQWFNVRAFPTASFVSTGVKALGGDRYEAIGRITIKGRSENATLPFSVKIDGKTATFDGSMILKRLDFAIGEGAWSDIGTVANDVQVKFRIVATSK